jgi:putative ABC transport system permease protein
MTQRFLSMAASVSGDLWRGLLDADRWQEIGDMLRSHKLRTLLTAFGIFWGILMLMVLLGAGSGIENGVVSQFGSLRNAVFIWSIHPTTMPYKGFAEGRQIAFLDDDIAAIRRNFSEVALVGASNDLGAEHIIRGDNADTFMVSGVTPEIYQARGYGLLKGRFINPTDYDQQRKVVVIGTRVRDMLFGRDEDPLGQRLEIKGMSFMVVGVFMSSRLGNSAQRESELVLMPNSTLRNLFGQQHYIAQILLIPKPDVKAKHLESKVKQFLGNRHDVHPDDHIPISSHNMQKEFNKINDLFTGIKVFSWLISIATIIAGVIGVCNIMLIVVKERTREIGIRKALGARPASIVGMITQECLTIICLSGYLGLIAGVFAVEAVSHYVTAANARNEYFSNPELDFQTAVIAIVALAVIGSIAAFIPAKKAASIDPVVALRDE